MYNGTKHGYFPTWLHIWLKCRKQFGLLAFAFAVSHAMMSLAMMTPNYMRSWFHPTAAKLPVDILAKFPANNTDVANFVNLEVGHTEKL